MYTCALQIIFLLLEYTNQIWKLSTRLRQVLSQLFYYFVEGFPWNLLRIQELLSCLQVAYLVAGHKLSIYLPKSCTNFDEMKNLVLAAHSWLTKTMITRDEFDTCQGRGSWNWHMGWSIRQEWNAAGLADKKPSHRPHFCTCDKVCTMHYVCMSCTVILTIFKFSTFYTCVLIEISHKQHVGDDESQNKTSLQDARRGESRGCTLVYREASNKGRCSRKNSQIG